MKVLVKDEYERTIRTYSSIRGASKGENLSPITIKKSINGGKIRGRYHFVQEGKTDRYAFRKRVVLIKDNGDLKVYNTQKQLAEELGISLGAVSNYIHGRGKPKGMKLFDYDYYVSMWGEPKEQEAEAEKEYSEEIKEEVKEEITHKTETMYYVNVLVGLANGTLEDGATYEIRGNVVKYSKENQALMLNEMIYISKDSVLEEVKVEYPLLLEKEKNFLKNLLVAFRDVKGIRKCNGIQTGTEFIRIETSSPVENVDLPTFKENQYYQSLKQNRLYSLDELGL